MYWTSWKPSRDSFNGLGANFYPSVSPIWWLPYSTSAIANLPQDITINGVTVSPSFRYEASNATASAWTATVGSNLSIASTGTDPNVGRDTPLLSATDTAVRMMGGTVFECANGSDTQIDTEDIVIELFGSFGNTASVQQLMGTYNGSTGVGWRTYTNSTQIITQLVISTNLNMVTNLDAAESYQYLAFFVDRSEASTNGCKWYKNGILNNSANPSVASGSISNANKFVIGSSTAYGNKVNDTSDLIYCAMYKRSNWFAGGAQNATDWEIVARTRTAQLAGVMPSIYQGTEPPTTKTRASTAFLDKTSGNARKIFLVGGGWPRVCRRTNYTGTSAGLLVEDGKTNAFGSSIDPTNLTYWTRNNLATPTNSLDLPWLTTVSATVANQSSVDIIPDGYTTYHGLEATASVTTGDWIASIFAKAVNRNWLNIQDVTLGIGATFDLSNGVVGTTTGSCTPKIESWGNGWYRCWIYFVGTTATHTFRFNSANDTADGYYAGDGTSVGTRIWAPQAELHQGTAFGGGTYPSSPALGTGATTTRNSDRFEYSVGNLTYPLCLQATVAHGPLTISGKNNGSTVVHLTQTAGGSTGSQDHNLGINQATYKVGASTYTASAQVSITGTTTMFDGYTHTLTYDADTNNTLYKMDGLQESTTDTSCTMPTLSPGYLQPGFYGTGRNSLNSSTLISDVKIWNRFR